MASRLPHICFVAPSAYPILARQDHVEFAGGAEIQQAMVARGLVKRGFPVSMICMDFGQDDGVLVDGVRVYRTYKPEEGLPVLRFLYPRLSKTWAALTRANADIYYQRTAGMLTGVMAVWCKRHGRLSIFAAAGNPDLVTNTPRIRYARDRRIYEYGLKHVDQILVQNDEQSRLCRLNYGRDSRLIPNFYCLPEFGDSDPDESCILWVATLRGLKRPDIFLDLAQALPDYRFKMAGGPSNEDRALYETIKARAKSLGNVDFVGFVPFSNIDEHFDNALVFVNTSESEGFPNTFLQAWARGVPTVSFIDSGARLDGRIVGRRPESFKEMVDEVRRLADQREHHRVESLRCKRYFEEHHSEERVLDLYEELLAELRGGFSDASGVQEATGSHENRHSRADQT